MQILPRTTQWSLGQSRATADNHKNLVQLSDQENDIPEMISLCTSRCSSNKCAKPVECEAKNTYFIGHLEPNIVGITVVATPMEGNHITRNNMHTLQLWFHAMDFFYILYNIHICT